MISTRSVAAVEDPGGMDALDLFTQYGVLGIAAAVLGVFARAAYKRETDRSDRLESEVSRLHTVIQERHIPALEAAARANQEATLALRDIQQERDMERTLRERERRDREVERSTREVERVTRGEERMLRDQEREGH